MISAQQVPQMQQAQLQSHLQGQNLHQHKCSSLLCLLRSRRMESQVIKMFRMLVTNSYRHQLFLLVIRDATHRSLNFGGLSLRRHTEMLQLLNDRRTESLI